MIWQCICGTVTTWQSDIMKSSQRLHGIANANAMNDNQQMDLKR
jgi:hypothetical protein